MHHWKLASAQSALKYETIPSITVRNVPEEVFRAISVRAAIHGRSAEGEIRSVLSQAARPEGHLKPGSLLTSFAREAGGLSDAEGEQFDRIRDKTPTEPMSFK